MKVFILGSVCAKKWKDLVDTFRRKVDKSGSAGVPLNDKVLQWKFWDRMSFLKDYIVNRKLVNNLHSVSIFNNKYINLCT